MIPEPLHPAVVHFPIVLAVLLPLFAAGGVVAVRRGVRPSSAWALPLAFACALSASTWGAIETGEAEEDRAERVVGEAVLHEHEEAAERLLVLSIVTALVAVAGLAAGALGAAARVLTLAASLVVLAAAIQTGRLGGELVYVHGAAAAYAGPDARGGPSGRARDERAREE